MPPSNVMKFLIVASVVVGTLALLNPTKEDFAQFAQTRAQAVVADRARESSGLFGEIGRSVLGTLAREAAGRAVERTNYVVCSVYTLDLNGRSATGGEWVFLGIGTQFIELERPAMLE